MRVHYQLFFVVISSLQATLAESSLVDICIEFAAKQVKYNNIDQIYENYFTTKAIPQELAAKVEQKFNSNYGWTYYTPAIFPCPKASHPTVAITPDSNYVITVFNNNIESACYIWDKKNKWNNNLLFNSQYYTSTVALSSNSALIAAANNEQVRIWEKIELAEKTIWHCTATLLVSDHIKSLEFSSDNQLLLVVTLDNKFHILRKNTKSLTDSDSTWLVTTVEVPNVYEEIKLSPDSQYVIATLERTPILYLWEQVTGWQCKELQGHYDIVKAIAISSNGDTIFSGSEDGVLRIWERNKNWESTVLITHSSPIISVTKAYDDSFFVSWAEDSTLFVWEKKQNAWKQTQLSGYSGMVNYVGVTPDSCSILVGVGDTLYIYNKEKQWQNPALAVHNSPVWTTLMPSTTCPLISRLENGTAYIWEKNDAWEPTPMTGYTGKISRIGVALNGTFVVATVAQESGIHIWHKQKQWISTHCLEHSVQPIFTIAPDSSYIASVNSVGQLCIYTPGSIAYILCSLAWQKTTETQQRQAIRNSKLFATLPEFLKEKFDCPQKHESPRATSE